MTLIQNEDNKCPTTKQVNDALKSMGGVQTLVLTTKDLIYPGRSSNIEVNSADSAVMEIVKSNMTDMVPFQLLYYGVSNGTPTCVSVTIVGAPIANVFTLYVNVSQGGLQYFSLNKGSNQKWTASTLSNS
ncbi:MAG: hypothetical protein [Bacteriophage sp.]|nr:MAG: hypothetical protein [Bacteriophage sp.]